MRVAAIIRQYRKRHGMSASYRLFGLSLAFALLAFWLGGIGSAQSLVNESAGPLPAAGSATFWQRLKASVLDFQWQQAKPDVESAATVQRRREMWQRLTVATVL
ncbi:uncharacterized protein LOC115770124 [Drosophila novamexicana]|uniref:uncharacterized protein LOC115770124 n=1 Tax=Drosophila novamexicana TaxID=47314 RepID=UPI0011E5A52A|nr:uncharacterized protein LOC115770124 [Drosophila novamexicana]